jgi:hypothetical protein
LGASAIGIRQDCFNDAKSISGRMKLGFQERISTNLFLLAGILILGAVLRLYHANQPFVDIFSWRQASTAMMASNFYHKSWNILYPEVDWNGPHPGYQGREFQTVTYLAALLYVVLRQHDWIGRAVASCFGLWGIFALYSLVRRVWDDQRALLSAAVLAVMPGAVFIDRSFLPDPAMVALATTSVWMFVAYFQTQGTRLLVAGGAVGAWALLSKLGALIVGFPILYSAINSLRFRHRLNARTAALGAVIGLLVMLPAALYYAWAIHLGSSYPPYHIAGQGNWPWNDGLQRWLSEKYFLPPLIHHCDAWLWTKPVAVLVLIGGIVPLLRRWRQANGLDAPHRDAVLDLQWLFHWWFVGFVLFYLIGAKELVSNPWNLHILNPAAAAFAGSALGQIGSVVAKIVRGRGGTLLKGTVVLFCLITILVWGQLRIAPLYGRQQLGYELGLALRQVSAPSDLVITIPSWFGDPIALYYSQRRGWAFPLPMADYLPSDDRESIKMFEQLRAEGARWLGIVAPQRARLKRRHPLLLAHFERTCRLVRTDRNCSIYSMMPEEANSH